MVDFVPFLLLLLVIAALMRVDFFFTVVYLLAAIYLFSRLWIGRAGRQIEAQRRFVARAFPGDQIEVELVVENGGRLPLPWLELHESFPVQLGTPPFHRAAISLGPRERRCFRYTLAARQRGYYPIGPLALRTGDLLGFARQQTAHVGPEALIVYPRVVPLQRLGLPTHSPQVALPARFRLFEDPARVMGVREYRPGDPLRRVHWTATASAGQLLVKQFQPSIARETVIYLDLSQDGYEQRRRHTAVELAIVVAASLANHVVIREGLPVGLVTEALDPLAEEVIRFALPPRGERAHLMSVLEVLARVRAVPDVSFVDLVRSESVGLPWGATLAVITGRESEHLFDTLLHLRQSGFAVTLILVQPALLSVTLRERADLLGITIHHVWRETDLEAWQ